RRQLAPIEAEHEAHVRFDERPLQGRQRLGKAHVVDEHAAPRREGGQAHDPRDGRRDTRGVDGRGAAQRQPEDHDRDPGVRAQVAHPVDR
ncbi:hypothetical protein RZS08_67530, partial [Arthrospira platensis SPKY1]|nr:hypothetical protein [Arthrospira platensis SPKY1]